MTNIEELQIQSETYYQEVLLTDNYFYFLFQGGIFDVYCSFHF